MSIVGIIFWEVYLNFSDILGRGMERGAFMFGRRRKNRSAPGVIRGAGTDATIIEPQPDDDRHGRHIAKLLELARRPGTTNKATIRDWNEWVKNERERDADFRLSLHSFDANASYWKETPLWDKRVPAREERCLSLHDIDWSNANIDGSKLDGAILLGANLKRSSMWRCQLNGANLSWAKLDGAELIESDMRNAILRGAQLTSADFHQCDFDGAIFSGANFAHAKNIAFRKAWRNCDLTDTNFAFCNLSGGDFTGAILRKADFTQADVSGITYQHYDGIVLIPLWLFRRDLMLGRYLGIRGIDSCFGNPGFRRDAFDQDFIDDRYTSSLILRNKHEISTLRSWRFLWLPVYAPVRLFRRVRWGQLHRLIPRRIAFWLWSFTDYGRSVASVLFLASFIIILFGALYQYVLIPHQDVVFGSTLSEQRNLPFRAWFAAAMGAATLGLTDLVHPRTWIGEATMIGNVLSGLVMFGMMIAVLQNKFARRS